MILYKLKNTTKDENFDKFILVNNQRFYEASELSDYYESSIPVRPITMYIAKEIEEFYDKIGTIENILELSEKFPEEFI